MKPTNRRIVRQYRVETLEGRTLLSGLNALKLAAAHLLKTTQVKAHASTLHQTSVAVSYNQQLQKTKAANAAALKSIVSIPENSAGGQVTPTSKTIVPFSGSISSNVGGGPNLSALANTGIGYDPRLVVANSPKATSTPVVTSVTAPSTPVTTATTTASATATTSTATPVTTATPTTGPLSTPGSLLGTTTLSAGDVSSLKSAVNTFAGAYTNGANASTDAAASSAFQTSLKTLDATIFSENHAVPASSVSAFQLAVDNFASVYTSGKSPSTDAAALVSLESALGSFGNAANTTNNTPPASGPGGNSGLSGVPLLGFLNGLVSGPTLTATQTSTLKTAVNAFASSYTDGTNKTTDTSAVTALGTSLGTIMPSNAPMAGAIMANTTLTATQVSSLQAAMDSFAANYTDGANITKDGATLSSLQSALASTLPGNLSGALDSLFGSSALTKAKVASLKTAFDSFTAAYTSGANSTTDAAAVTALNTSLATAFPTLKSGMAIPF